MAVQRAGIDMGAKDRRCAVSAIEAVWRKCAAGVVPAKPKARPKRATPYAPSQKSLFYDNAKIRRKTDSKLGIFATLEAYL